MPRAFKEEEKEKIRAKLLEAGRSCFLRYGLKKTTIEDVVGPAEPMTRPGRAGVGPT